jgi:hypothetical protein
MSEARGVVGEATRSKSKKNTKKGINYRYRSFILRAEPPLAASFAPFFKRA